jgi:hypothetical protein
MKRIILALVALLAALPAGAQMNLPTTTGVVTATTGIGTGTTGAVTATLAGVASKTTYICGFSVSGAGSGSLSPITITGIVGGTLTYQGISAGVAPYTQPFWACLPAANTNGAIVITTTADGTATAVNVQAWGFQQ